MAGAALISGCGEKNDPLRELPLKIIGITEPVFLEPFKTPFPAKIDTGADIASLDAKEIQEFVRDGKPYVAFTVVQRKPERNTVMNCRSSGKYPSHATVPPRRSAMSF
jgi:Uncharacterized protein conserved in archaea